MVTIGNVKTISLVALAVVIVVVIWRSAPGIQQSLGSLGGGLTQSIASAGGGISGFFNRLGGTFGQSIINSVSGGLFGGHGGTSGSGSGGTASTPAFDPSLDGSTTFGPDGTYSEGYGPPGNRDVPGGAPPSIPSGLFAQSAPAGEGTNRISVDGFNQIYRGDRAGGEAALLDLAAQGYRLKGDYLVRQSGRRTY